MPTPYDGKVGLWHVSGGWVGEATIEELCQAAKQQCPVADAIWVKTSNGRVWQGENDTKAAMEINGPADIAKWIGVLNTFNLEFHAWAVIMGSDIATETARVVEACKVPGVKSIILDVEPHDGYWQGSAAQVGQLMTGIRNALGSSFHIGISVDPRRNYYSAISPDAWRPYINSVHPQVYWELMGRTPQDVLDETYVVWGNYGLPIIPVLQGWANADSIRTAQDIARSVRGATGLSYFRLGVISPLQFEAINAEIVGEEIGPDSVKRFYGWEKIIAPGEAGYAEGTHTGQPITAETKSLTSARGQLIRYKKTEAAQDRIWVQWTPQLPNPGLYEISVYIPGRHATTAQARYHIHGITGAASELLVRLNQNIYYNVWVPLVVYEFTGKQGSGQVNLTDLTSESDKEIAFSAIRWREVVEQEQLVVDPSSGFDPPVGTAEERLSGQVWPGKWYDATGFATYYTTVGPAYHTGADLNLASDADRNAPVYAPAKGVVTFSGKGSGTWGQLIVIRHDPLSDGSIVWSRLAHVTNRLVSEGDRVDRGQQVANVGNADGQLPYHLHIDIVKTSVVESNPNHWPGNNLDAVLRNYVDPRQFIIDHRPPGRAG
jgi:murein DD-endopeptidase MepM/ murein hydrolase activator NlpD